MSQDHRNPYDVPVKIPVNVPESRRLADLGKRLLGALCDMFAFPVCLGPGYAVYLLAQGVGQEDPDDSLAFVGVILLLAGGVTLVVVQLYLMATRSQTIGKYLLNTQVVDHYTNERANFLTMLLLRGVVSGLPRAVPFVGWIYGLIDVLCIFRDDRRCVHDLIAGTSVIDLS